MLTLPLLTLVLLTTSVELTLTAPAAEGVNAFISLIEQEALKLTDESLTEDTLLHQEVIAGTTIYRHSKSEKHGTIVFVRKGSDEGKGVVVLQEGEDYLPKCKTKRTFVTLKQSSGDKKTYRVVYAYIRESSPQVVEWDSWFPKGNPRNKALTFGFVRCGKSSMIPCKKDPQIITDDSPDYEDFGSPSTQSGGSTENKAPVAVAPLEISHPHRKINDLSGNDYFCDLHEVGAVDSRFTGAVIGALAQSMIVLSGAELVYKEDKEIVKEIQEEIKAVVPIPKMQGRSFGGQKAINNATSGAATKLVDLGRQTVAGGTLLFYAAIVKVGALALHETPLDEIPVAPTPPAPAGTTPAEPASTPEMDQKSEKYTHVGLNLLRGFFRGVIEDPEQPRANPNPEELLKETVAENLIAGRSVGDTSGGNGQQSGRGMLSWVFGKADIGTSAANGEQVIRSYKGIQKDGAMTGSKGGDNLFYAIDNAFQQSTRKSAGTIFAENIVAGVYMPYGLIEDAGDALGGSILGIGRISTDRSYIDDILDKAMNVVAGAGGQVVDVVGDILGPIGLGGLWSGVAGFTAGTLGVIGGGIASPVLGIYSLIKMGAKAIGIGGVIGMHGDESRQANIGGNQNIDRYSPPQTPQQILMGRKRRAISQSQEPSVVSITDVDLFSHMGWKTVDISQQAFANASTDQNDEVFVGFGNCIYKKPSAEEFAAATSPKELTKLYARTLRVQCLQDQVEAITELFSKGFLALAADKTFNIPTTQSALTKAKLSSTEINELSKAFEISRYTQAYVSATKSPGFLVAGSSRSASLLKLMSLNFLDEALKSAPLHFVKLVRNIAKILKTAFTKSLQDFFRYKHCRKCAKEHIKETLNDLILLLGLQDFVLVEEERAEFKDGPKGPAFDTWFNANKQAIAKRVTVYFS